MSTEEEVGDVVEHLCSLFGVISGDALWVGVGMGARPGGMGLQVETWKRDVTGQRLFDDDGVGLRTMTSYSIPLAFQGHSDNDEQSSDN